MERTTSEPNVKRWGEEGGGWSLQCDEKSLIYETNEEVAGRSSTLPTYPMGTLLPTGGREHRMASPECQGRPGVTDQPESPPISHGVRKGSW